MDLTGMDPVSAKEYIAAVLSTLKQTKIKRIELQKELEKWKSRVILAGDQGRTDLQAEAALKAEQIQDDLQKIMYEELELKKELDIVKSQLLHIQNQPEITVDADLLLAQLEMVVGERDELADKFKEAEADLELKQLKKEMDL